LHENRLTEPKQIMPFTHAALNRNFDSATRTRTCSRLTIFGFAALVLALPLRAAATDIVTIRPPGSDTNSFLKVVAREFPGWDLNHDGVLGVDEINAAVSNPQTVNRAAAAIAALKRAVRSTKNVMPPLTLSNIDELTAKREPDFALMYEEGWSRLRGSTNHVLFVNGSPRLETIHQGKLGNCFCLAPLGAMVERDPKQVASMFSEQTNGNYCVKLGKQNVEIAPPTDAEIAMTSSNEREGIWVNIYEKAVGAARNEQRPPDERVALSVDALARGGSAGTMLAMITGHEITRFSFKFAKDTHLSQEEFNSRLAQLREQLSVATAENRLMTCGTLKPTTPGLTPNHAYAVFRYAAATDAVELWNPHGQTATVKGTPGPANGYPTANGVFWIPVPEFVRQFSGMAFEVPPSAAVLVKPD
jgi:hypothetical protein